jgi:hypothetical protein
MGWNDGKDPIVIEEMTLYVVTDKAILVGPPECEDHEKHWIPQSQIYDTDLDYESDEALYTEGYVSIPRWLAEEKGLA